MVIRTPDFRLRVFVSSTLKELAEERKVVRQSILKLRLAPVMFESGARPHPAQELYKSYLSQSQIFIGIYWQSYGWVAPEMQISGLEDEYNRSSDIPRLIYIKNPAPDREPALTGLLNRIRSDNSSSYTSFSTTAELKELVQNDLALMLTEKFESMSRNEQTRAETRKYPLTNVPIPRNQLIGREQELATICDLIQQDDIALITLTGAGGTGKSRLALQAGFELLDYFKDGVYLVRLEPISDPDLVIPTIAETLGIRESPGSRPIREMLKEFLHDKQMLLILDNFEQVVEVAPYVAELLESCRRLKCIATSRTPLRLRAEKELPVPPLSLPSLQKSTDLGSLSQYSAVELFIQRAQAVKPDFSVTNANAPAVAEVCYRLDGLPLAIELAAARIKLLTPQGLLNRLEHRFELLRGGARDLPERQRTLRSTIDWSYNLLNEGEMKLFRRLSIFVGGWTLEAAEMVCDINGDLTQTLDDLLASLIDNNLVIQIQDHDDQPRFGMLSTIHEYAYERLSDTDEAYPVHFQHAQYYLNFVTTTEPLVRSAERARWQQVMQQEFGNVRGVLEWVFQTGKCIEIGQQIVIAFGVYWLMGGYIVEGQRWCDQMMALCNESTPVAIRAGLLYVFGVLAWSQGDHVSAVTNLDKSLKLSHTLDDQRLYANAMLVRGMAALASRDLPVATAMFQGSIELFKVTNNLWFEATATSWLGDIALYENDIDNALALHSQSIKLARQQGDPWCVTPPLMSTAQLALVNGDLPKARPILEEVVDLLHKTGDNWSLSWALNDLGHVALMEGELNQAGKNFLEGLTLANTLGNLRVLIVLLTGTAALITRRSKNFTDARQENNSELDLAARLCGATAPFLETPGIFLWFDTKKLYEDSVSQSKSSMDADFWDKAYSEGQKLPFDQAINLAIQALKESK